MKKKVLLCGEHPYSRTGNGNMMQVFLSQIDYDRYDVICFVANIPDMKFFDPFAKKPYSLMSSNNNQDPFGISLLPGILNELEIDLLITIGVDIWQYQQVSNAIEFLKKKKDFKWGAVFPYDFVNERKEIIELIKKIDFPYVYSQYGYDVLKDCTHTQYFRPKLFDHDKFYPISSEEIDELRAYHFSTVPKDAFIFGFIGPNQFRKEPHKVLKAFSLLQKSTDRPVYLYMHTNLHGAYNLNQLILDFDISVGSVVAKNPEGTYDSKWMNGLHNCLDAYINCSMQEGLSWTVLEAMKTGTPVILSDTTAHKDLITDGMLSVPCSELGTIPIITGQGTCLVETRCCNFEDIFLKMKYVLDPSDKITNIINDQFEMANSWIEGTHHFNDILDCMSKGSPKVQVIEKMDRALFAQHSSAGDVFMTTRCFKGIVDRYKVPLDYMTSPKFVDIVSGNPYLDKVLDWNEELFKQYKYVLNPHGERILPGHWGRNSNSILSDFYWKILDVEPDDFYIKKEKPIWMDDDKNVNPIVIVHTTGGDAHFRVYKYMVDVCTWLRENRNCATVQLGGKDDFPAGADLDMRGNLTYKESAYLMSISKLAITVDSFISHLAGALSVPQICLFGSGNASVVRPNQVSGPLICLSPDYIRICKGLGPCSQSIRECPAPCTGSIPPERIINSILEIEKISRQETK